jgi:hypothetical protein
VASIVTTVPWLLLSISLLDPGSYLVFGIHWNFLWVPKLYIGTAQELLTVALVCRHWYRPDRNLPHGSPPRPGCISCWRCILSRQFPFPLYFHHATCRCTLITDVRQEYSEIVHLLLYQVAPCLLWRKALFSVFSHLLFMVINIHSHFFRTMESFFSKTVSNQNELASYYYSIQSM